MSKPSELDLAAILENLMIGKTNPIDVLTAVADQSVAMNESLMNDIQVASKALLSLFLDEIVKLRDVRLTTPAGRMQAQIQHGVLLAMGQSIALKMARRGQSK